MKALTKGICDYASSVLDALPDNVKREIALCNASLYHGPIYLTAEGEETSMFDADYDHAHDFRAGTALIGDALAAVCDCYFDEDGCYLGDREPEGEEIDGEYYEPPQYYAVSAKEINQAILGKELASYI